MLRRVPVFLLPLLLAAACSTEPRDRPIPSDPSAWRSNTEFRNTVEALPSPDRTLVQNWMLRHAFAAGKGEAIPTRTIGEAIEEQRKLEAEKKGADKSKAAAGADSKAEDAKAEAAP
ncbi:MAG: hypothetical protein AAGF11_44305 [Myxococcota bacterium]